MLNEGFVLSPLTNQKMKKIIITIVGILFITTAGAQPQGVLLSEYRMILKNNTIASLQVSNPTDKPQTYTLTITEKKITNNGDIVTLPDSVPLPTSLKSYLKVFPRIVKLAPGESQELQIQLRVPSSVPDGEYRSYLQFQPLDNSGTTNGSSKNNGVQFAIKFRVGSAIPIFYRKNTQLSSVIINDVSLSKTKQGTALNMTINRVGTRSTFGNVVVSGISKGKPVEIMNAAGVAVYPEVAYTKKEFPIAIGNLDRGADGKVSLTITYYNSEDKSKPKSIIYTTKTIDVMPPK